MKQYDKVFLVTGGAGFIGSAFLRMLVPKYPNWFFINLDALTYAGDLRKVESINNFKNYTFVHGNICDRELIDSLFHKFSINIVVNFAAESHVDNSISDPNSFLLTNIVGTHCLINVAKIFWTKRNTMRNSKFIQISTDEVYGSLNIGELSSTEIDNLLPNSPYSTTKAAAELICRSYFQTFGFPVVITRSSNNYGPFQNKEKLIPKIIFNAFNNLNIPVYGNGLNIRDWIHVDDNVDAIYNVLLNGRIGEIYNVGGENEITNIEIVNKILRILDKSPKLVEFVQDRLGHDFRYSLNIDKIKNLKWQPKVDMITGLATTVEHYLERINE